MSPKLDPVTLEVIRNALPAISNEMAADLQRTSYNMMIYEVRDFCTALISTEGELISQNVGGVSHFVADLGVIITDGMQRYGKAGFQDGDVLIMNHPAVAGQHLNNICIYVPYFFKGELLMFSMVRAHWIDVGGMSTGFGAGRAAQDPWMEGLQFNQLKIYEGGKVNEMLFQMIKDNIRFPESSLGDLRSQIAACRLGNRRADELFERYGRDTVMAAIRQVFDETEQRCRNAVKQIADGVYEAESFIDDTGENPPEPVRINAKITVKQGQMTIDLSECSKERPHGPNCRSLAGARIAYKGITAPLDPVNEGSFRALDIILPEGNFMMARHPIPMQGWSLMLPTVADTIVAALAPAMKDKAPAGHHADLGGSAFFGVDPKTKRRFVLQSIDGGGWGGRPHEDGESGSVSICQGDVRNGAIEAIELKCPVMIEKRGFRQDSGGAGKYRGGLGIEFQIPQFRRRPLESRQALSPGPRLLAALGRRARHDGGLIDPPAGRERIPRALRPPLSRAGGDASARAPLRRRRLGRPIRSRSRAGALGRRRRLCLARGRGGEIRRGVERRSDARCEGDRGATREAAYKHTQDRTADAGG